METEKGTYDSKLLSRARTAVKHTSDDEPPYMPLDDTVPFPRVIAGRWAKTSHFSDHMSVQKTHEISEVCRFPSQPYPLNTPMLCSFVRDDGIYSFDRYQ